MQQKKMLLLTISTVLFFIVKAQTADDIVDKYFTAIGGKDKIASLKTMLSKGEMTIMNNPAPFSTYVSDGTGYRSEVELNGQKIITCYINGSGWTVNPLAGTAEPTPLPADQVIVGKMTYDLKGPLYNYAAKGSKLAKLGATEVKLTGSDGTETHFFFDGTTGYLLKSISLFKISGNSFEITTVNSNYQPTSNGMMMPYTTEVSYPGLTITAVTKTIVINEVMDTAIFQQPRQ